MTFTGMLETIGKGFEKGLKWAVEYAVPVERLIGLLFPAAGPATAVLADATTLIQNAVLLVEQKYAAAGAQTGTGAQKLADVLQLSGQAVTGLLTQGGIAPGNGYVASLVSAVVAILNVQQMPAAVSAGKPAAAIV